MGAILLQNVGAQLGVKPVVIGSMQKWIFTNTDSQSCF